MALTRIGAAEMLDQLEGFETIIDARSPLEYAADRVPGAVNWPSLDDAERAEIGTADRHVSAFEARKRGAAFVARNIAAHLERELPGRAKEWSPLVYCWRGGQRSGALALVLDQIGFRVRLLDGGYRAFRRAVVTALDELPHRLDLRIVCGPTGSGKSRLLAALAGRGAQVLDLEALAHHRGSVLGLLPGSRQPSQKHFDTAIWDASRRFDATRPVFVESESRKIGDLRVPETLIQRMRGSRCLWLELATPRRVALLMGEYRHFVDDADALCKRLDALRTLRGHAAVDAWQEAARAGRVDETVRDLLEVHYDPIYLQSLRRNFGAVDVDAVRIEWDGSQASLDRAATLALGTAPDAVTDD